MDALAFTAMAADRSGARESAKRGGLAAFDSLMRQYERLVLATALRLTGNLEDAQDASQEVFLKLYRNLGKLEDREDLAPWLYRVTVNVCRDLRRKKPASAEEADAAAPGDLTVYFIVGGDEPAGPTPAPAAPVPAELQSTVAALKQAFPFKNYSLLDALSTRVRAGSGGEASGQLNAGRISEFGVRSVSVEPDGTGIKLEHLFARVRRPRTAEGKVNYLDSGVSSDVVDIKRGQKLVIGRSSLDGPGKALFLVLIAVVQ